MTSAFDTTLDETISGLEFNNYVYVVTVVEFEVPITVTKTGRLTFDEFRDATRVVRAYGDEIDAQNHVTLNNEAIRYSALSSVTDEQRAEYDRLVALFDTGNVVLLVKESTFEPAVKVKKYSYEKVELHGALLGK